MARPSEPPAPSTLSSRQLTVAALTQACAAAELPVEGSKADLLERLAPLCVPPALRTRVRAGKKDRRRAELKAALAGRGLELRSDSTLCTAYIEDRQPLPLPSIVKIMDEMRWYFARTRYDAIRYEIFEERYEELDQELEIAGGAWGDDFSGRWVNPQYVSDDAKGSALSEFLNALQDVDAADVALADPILPPSLRPKVQRRWEWLVARYLREATTAQLQAALQPGSENPALASRINAELDRRAGQRAQQLAAAARGKPTGVHLAGAGPRVAAALPAAMARELLIAAAGPPDEVIREGYARSLVACLLRRDLPAAQTQALPAAAAQLAAELEKLVKRAPHRIYSTIAGLPAPKVLICGACSGPVKKRYRAGDAKLKKHFREKHRGQRVCMLHPADGSVVVDESMPAPPPPPPLPHPADLAQFVAQRPQGVDDPDVVLLMWRLLEQLG